MDFGIIMYCFIVGGDWLWWLGIDMGVEYVVYLYYVLLICCSEGFGVYVCVQLCIGVCQLLVMLVIVYGELLVLDEVGLCELVWYMLQLQLYEYVVIVYLVSVELFVSVWVKIYGCMFDDMQLYVIVCDIVDYCYSYLELVVFIIVCSGDYFVIEEVIVLICVMVDIGI